MRKNFQDDIDRLLEQLQATAAICDEMLEDSLRALAAPGAPGAEIVVERDNEVDAAYKQIQESVLSLFALQAPVASDLRLLAALLQANIHVERLGDYATSIARTAERLSGLDDDEHVTRVLTEMGRAAVEVSRAALRSLIDRDVALARSLPAKDDEVDTRYFEVFRHLIRPSSLDDPQLEWATSIIVVARSIERYGDHAVDIGEQTIYAVTGELVELSSNDPRVGG
jgi:phosphate transport system protein